MANTHALDNDPAMSRDQGSTKDIAVDGGPEDGKTHQFNEQTNYVPQRAIITTMLATSLYIIGNALGSTSQASWIASGYFITSTVGQLMYGRLSDIWSRKIILLMGLAIFFIGSIASSLADSVLQLTIFRAFTGIGGGGLMTVAQLIVSDVVPLRERGKYQGILDATAFDASDDTMEIGNWLTWGGKEYAWNSTQVISTLSIGTAVSIAFMLWQWKGPKYPLIPLHMFKSKIVNGACLTMAINGWNFVMQVYYIPSFYQLVYGYSATKAGAMLLPITLLQTASSTLSGLVVHWIGRYRECILFGWLCWAVGLGLMSTLDENTGVDKQIGYSVLIGIGVGNTLQPALIATQAGVDRCDMAVVTSFRNFVRNLGATLGLTVCGTVLNNVLAGSLSSLNLNSRDSNTLLENPQSFLGNVAPDEAERIRSVLIPAYREGFRIIFLIGAGAASLAFVLAFVLMPQVNLTRPDDLRLKEEGRTVYEEKRSKGNELWALEYPVSLQARVQMQTIGRQ
ncbi:hypothetical protein FGSG_01997 [Fusarium graminearum PH-1]|uniref:Chromosome 1, complete genome n=1 Tax=Gibberella zeae (strain ATCC MYA-4620 / CBS 123657 / FGSC 9075 / NRRL 31084 / PH-1) TaxID=229533 RepID=I1REB3_GIBZE|nr:hypothetical protein FGSG_01997 [Fusarium graminearum PH-1]ESU07377.1 hypothetical protein FGSG_01997 [Fusarium graminearum PH-1]CEF74216.1 unnamed protein product [Fusarium graminearum]|eukprot:XP_011317862.1 hypothetical protein FGSG_01997 [Fusarium graminearum PH-1]